MKPELKVQQDSVGSYVTPNVNQVFDAKDNFITLKTMLSRVSTDLDTILGPMPLVNKPHCGHLLHLCLRHFRF